MLLYKGLSVYSCPYYLPSVRLLLRGGVGVSGEGVGGLINGYRRR